MSKGFRVISGLIEASACPRPKCIPQSRPRGAKRAGLKYERDLARGIPGAKHGQWFEFTDRGGHGYCQPDVIFSHQGRIVVLESKYTWVESGHRQIGQLYKPVLERALARPVLGIVVCKVLTGETPRDWVCSNLDEAISRASLGLPTVLHWIGTGLGPLQFARPSTHLAFQPSPM